LPIACAFRAARVADFTGMRHSMADTHTRVWLDDVDFTDCIVTNHKLGERGRAAAGTVSREVDRTHSE